MSQRLPGLFVVGTDTGVGKTFVASSVTGAMVRQGRRVGVLKPVATGASRSGGSWQCEDAERLIEAAGAVVPLERVAPILYEEPLAPCVAARRSGEPLQPSRVREAVFDALDWWSERADVMVVEGVGGLLCPLAEGTTVADLAVTLDFPLLVVARRGLGTLNHTLLTVEAARHRGLRLAGVVLNSPEPETGSAAEATSADELARRLRGVPIVVEVPHVANFALSEVDDCVDWYERTRPPRSQGQG
jgi:dethiobiotin synthetase